MRHPLYPSVLGFKTTLFSCMNPSILSDNDPLSLLGYSVLVYYAGNSHKKCSAVFGETPLPLQLSVTTRFILNMTRIQGLRLPISLMIFPTPLLSTMQSTSDFRIALEIPNRDRESTKSRRETSLANMSALTFRHPNETDTISPAHNFKIPVSEVRLNTPLRVMNGKLLSWVCEAQIYNMLQLQFDDLARSPQIADLRRRTIWYDHRLN